MCTILPTSYQQDLSNCGCVFVGGLKALDMVNEKNLYGIDHIVDCRSDTTCNRWSLAYSVRLPPGVTRQELNIDRLCELTGDGESFQYAHEFQQKFEPLIEALGEGKSVLLHCTHGNRLSPLVAVMLHVAFFTRDGSYAGRAPIHPSMTNLEQCENLAREECQKLRSLCDFSTQTPGYRGDISHMAYCFFIHVRSTLGCGGRC